MRLFFSLCIMLLSYTFIYGQRIHEIKISKSDQPISQFSYYIDKVVDGRKDTTSIGKIYKGPRETEFLVQLKDGVIEETEDYLKSYLPKSRNAQALTLLIEEYKVAEVKNEEGVKATFELKVKLFKDDDLMSTEHLLVYKKGKNSRAYHASNIEHALRNMIIQFAAGYNPDKMYEYENNEEISVKHEEQLNGPVENRNVFAIGYQIGGWTLIGINYEFRLSNVFGIHFGGGWIGYSAGIKLHFDKYKDSGFLNLSFKDGGIGLIRTANIELGGRIPFSKDSDFGLHAQAGAGFVISINPRFSRYVFDSSQPNVIFSFGLGFSF